MFPPSPGYCSFVISPSFLYVKCLVIIYIVWFYCTREFTNLDLSVDALVTTFADTMQCLAETQPVSFVPKQTRAEYVNG